MAPELFIKAATAIWQKCVGDISAIFAYVTVLVVIVLQHILSHESFKNISESETTKGFYNKHYRNYTLVSGKIRIIIC
jgi:hypothetical protein